MFPWRAVAWYGLNPAAWVTCLVLSIKYLDWSQHPESPAAPFATVALIFWFIAFWFVTLCGHDDPSLRGIRREFATWREPARRRSQRRHELRQKRLDERLDRKIAKLEGHETPGLVALPRHMKERGVDPEDWAEFLMWREDQRIEKELNEL